MKKVRAIRNQDADSSADGRTTIDASYSLCYP